MGVYINIDMSSYVFIIPPMCVCVLSFFSSATEKTFLLSMKSWLFNRDPHNGLLWSPHNWAVKPPIYPKQTGFFDCSIVSCLSMSLKIRTSLKLTACTGKWMLRRWHLLFGFVIDSVWSLGWYHIMTPESSWISWRSPDCLFPATSTNSKVMEKTFSPTWWSLELGKPNGDGDHDRYQWLLDSISILSQKSGNDTKRWGQWGIITQRIVRAVNCKWLWAWSWRRKATAEHCWCFMSRIMTLRVLSTMCCFRWTLWPWAMICSESNQIPETNLESILKGGWKYYSNCCCL